MSDTSGPERIPLPPPVRTIPPPPLTVWPVRVEDIRPTIMDTSNGDTSLIAALAPQVSKLHSDFEWHFLRGRRSQSSNSVYGGTVAGSDGQPAPMPDSIKQALGCVPTLARLVDQYDMVVPQYQERTPPIRTTVVQPEGLTPVVIERFGMLVATSDDPPVTVFGIYEAGVGTQPDGDGLYVFRTPGNACEVVRVDRERVVFNNAGETEGYDGYGGDALAYVRVGQDFSILNGEFPGKVPDEIIKIPIVAPQVEKSEKPPGTGQYL